MSLSLQDFKFGLYFRTLKLTSMFTMVSTSRSFFLPGLNFHCFNALNALSVRPRASPRTTRRISIVPSVSVAGLSVHSLTLVAATSSRPKAKAFQHSQHFDPAVDIDLRFDRYSSFNASGSGLVRIRRTWTLKLSEESSPFESPPHCQCGHGWRGCWLA